MSMSESLLDKNTDNTAVNVGGDNNNTNSSPTARAAADTAAGGNSNNNNTPPRGRGASAVKNNNININTNNNDDYDDLSSANPAGLKPSRSVPGFVAQPRSSSDTVTISGNRPNNEVYSHSVVTLEHEGNSNNNGSGAGETRNGSGYSSTSTPGIVLEALHRFFMAFPVQIVMVLLTIIDIVFLIYEFSTNRTRFEILTMGTSTAFMVEVLASLGHLQHNYFLFERQWVVAEVAVVSTSFLVEYIQFILKIVFFTTFSSWIAYLRAVRFLRVLIVWKTRSKKLSTALRRLVSADRRRLEVGGYDLDLTYVNNRVIAMSWPSDGLEGLYRNNINHVAAYLNDRHPDSYLIFNLCSEREYDTSKFGFRVHRYKLDDHNPGALHVMVDFACDVDQFLRKSKKNVVIIHCKGGKGRTGTMICTHFLFSGFADTADQALAHFGKERTSDFAKSFQGVESPSQARYVYYFADLVKKAREQHIPIAVPPARPVRITRIRLHFVPVRWWDAARLWFAVIQNPSGDGDRAVHYLSNPTVRFNCNVGAVKGKHGKALLGETESSAEDNAPRAWSAGIVAYMAGPPASRSGADPFATADAMPVVSLEQVRNVQRQLLGEATDDNNNFGAGDNNASQSDFNNNSPADASISTNNAEKRVDIEFDCSQIDPVTSDVVLKFYYDEDSPDTLHCPLSVWFNVNMEADGAKIRYLRKDIDGPHKDPKCKKFPKDFAMSIDLAPAAAAVAAGAASSASKS